MVTAARKLTDICSLEEKPWPTCWCAQSCRVFVTAYCSLLGSSVHEASQARILEWVAISFSRMTNLGSMLKSRDITLPTKVHLVKAMVFPVVMYGCESWTIKKAEHWRIDAFELHCWRRLLRVPWTARRSNQSILKEIILNIHWKAWG